ECERYLENQVAFKDKSKNFEPNWNDGTQPKYCLYYDHDENSFRISGWNFPEQAVLYFVSREVLKELISRFGEDDVKKYYFGIED
ncbi:hypothetical protein, partial [Enterobacter asburiae]